jgi:cob(I)alamin adenosyltransferase
MGTIKDLVDLITQLTNSVRDRKVVSELNTIQSLVLKLQAEQAVLHEANIKLREDRLMREERIQELETRIKELSAAPAPGPEAVPTCPNCSTNSKPFYMRPVATSFVRSLNATHECPKCHYRTSIE